MHLQQIFVWIAGKSRLQFCQHVPAACAQHLDLRAEDARTLFGWNYYPAPKQGTPQAQQLRLLPHADTDVITLLFQRPGLPCPYQFSKTPGNYSSDKIYPIIISLSRLHLELPGCLAHPPVHLMELLAWPHFLSCSCRLLSEGSPHQVQRSSETGLRNSGSMAPEARTSAASHLASGHSRVQESPGWRFCRGRMQTRTRWTTPQARTQCGSMGHGRGDCRGGSGPEWTPCRGASPST